MRALLFALAIFLAGGAVRAAEVASIDLGSNALRLAAGGSVSIPLGSVAGILASADLRVEVETFPSAPEGLSGAIDARGLFLAAPPTLASGRYSVRVFITGEGGPVAVAEGEAQVDPLAFVAQSARAPVVLVTGFDVGSVTTGQCNVAPDSTGTFGELEKLLEADGASVVFFDNCRFGSPPIEVLGARLGETIRMLRHPDGSPVAQVDLIGFSMGALVVRSYLAGKQEATGEFDPPPDPRVRKLVLVGGEHMGAPLAELVTIGKQLPQLRTASEFIWDLATWNQGMDDLRGIDALAIAGNGASDRDSDAVAPLAGASLFSPMFFGFAADRTRVVDACHNSLVFLGCSSRVELMHVDGEDHETGRIIRSFLADRNDWRGIGETPLENEILREQGGVLFRVADEGGAVVRGLTRVVASDRGPVSPVSDEVLDRSPAAVFYRTRLAARAYQFVVSEGDSSMSAYEQTVAAGGVNVVAVKLGPRMARAQPAAGVADTLSLAPDSLISIFGVNLADSTESASAIPLPLLLGGAMVSVDGQPIELLFAGVGQINAHLPSGLTGWVKLEVANSMGRHRFGVMIEPAAPAIFTQDGTGNGIAAAVDALTGELITAERPAVLGGFVALFLTGLGESENRGGLNYAIIEPEVFLNGRLMNVLFAGSAPGFVGLNQINFEILAGTDLGDTVSIEVRSNGRMSNRAGLSVVE